MESQNTLDRASNGLQLILDTLCRLSFSHRHPTASSEIDLMTRRSIVLGIATLLVACDSDAPPIPNDATTSVSEPRQPEASPRAPSAMKRELDSLRDNTSGQRFGKSEAQRFQVFIDLYTLQDENRCLAEAKYPNLDYPDFDHYLDSLDAEASKVIENRHGLERTELDQILIEAVAKNWYAQMKEKPCVQ